MAKLYHPDRNRGHDTTELFQLLNVAYETLIDTKSRYMYDLYLQNPDESEYYRQYRYYSHQYVENPQVPIWMVVTGTLLLVSLMQYVMRLQMYKNTLERITQGLDFKNKVNERCRQLKVTKHKKEQVREQMKQQIQIEGGLSKPGYNDILFYKLVILPYTFVLWVAGSVRWVYKYWIKREPYDEAARSQLTKKALKVTKAQWTEMQEDDKKRYISKELWVKENFTNFQQQQKLDWLKKLKEQNPGHYAQVVKQMKKQQ